MIDKYVVRKYKEELLRAFDGKIEPDSITFKKNDIATYVIISVGDCRTCQHIDYLENIITTMKALTNKIKEALDMPDSRGVFMARNGSYDYIVFNYDSSDMLIGEDLCNIMDMISFDKTTIDNYTVTPLKKGEEYYVHTHEGEDEDYGHAAILFAKSEIDWF